MNAARALLPAVVCAALLAGEAQARAGQAGVVTAWGMDDIPLVQPGTRFKAVAAGVQLVALTTEGRIVAWRINGGQEPPSLGPVAGIAAGDEHLLALMPDGTVVAWGDNSYGQCDVPAGLTGVVAVSGGSAHSLALTSDGTVLAWGAGLTNNPSDNADFGQSIVPPGLSNVVVVSAGGFHSMALRRDGTVVAWGEGTTVPPGLNGVIAIAAGGWNSVAVVGGPVLTPPAPQPGGSMQLTLNGIAGWRYTVSGSTDLVNWTPLTSFVATNASTQIVDPAAGSFSHRFYRATAP